MKKHAFLEKMTAAEFVECLQDNGLYSLVIDTMVSMIENQGRCVNEALNAPAHGHPEMNPYIAEEYGFYEGYLSYHPRGEEALSCDDTDKEADPSDEIIASLNDPHNGTDNACWDGPRSSISSYW